MKKECKKIITDFIMPILLLGSATGILSALVVAVYKILAKYVILFSEKCYHYVGERLWIAPIIIIILFAISYILDYIYKKEPNVCGGGIPTAIAAIKGFTRLKWFVTLIGTFFLSILSFLIGVPLGNEGPSVIMGTAVGKGISSSFHKRCQTLCMTGGACTGFSVATSAPICGVLFAAEEAHRRITPLIACFSSVSVITGFITTKILSAVLNVNLSLFPEMALVKSSLTTLWLPALIGVLTGLFSVLFLKGYKVIFKFSNVTINKIPQKYKIFIILISTFLLGLCYGGFISTGHELILSVLKNSPSFIMLGIILIVRCILTLSANSNGITGGMFVPLLAIGAVFSALSANVFIPLFGLCAEYYTLILVLGITASIAGMMKTPLIAIVFSIEALSAYNNIPSVIIATVLAYAVTELFKVDSITEEILKNKCEA